MAVTVAIVNQTNDLQNFSYTSTADADTVNTSQAHLMGANATFIVLPLLQVFCSLSLAALTTMSATAWILTKATTAGSSTASPSAIYRVIAMRAK